MRSTFPFGRLASGSAFALLSLVLVLGCRDRSAANTVAPQGAHPPEAAAKAPASATGFDGARRLQFGRKQVAFGPRPAGSAALASTRKFIESELTSYGLSYREQPFTASTPAG